MTEQYFVGRERELNQLRLAIGPGTDGLRLAMLSGPSGLGKTTLTVRAISQARSDGFRVILANGRAGTISAPFSPLTEGFPEFADLFDSMTGGSQTDLQLIGAGVGKLLREITVDTPLLIVCDDVQAFDESSLGLLPYLVGVPEDINASFLFVEQSDAVDQPASYRAFIEGLLARRIVNHLELGPMADENIADLVRHTLGFGEDEPTPTEVVLRAQGNPWFAQELALAWRRGDDELPTNIAAAATSRIRKLDNTPRDLVFAAALCPEGAHLDWLERLADERPRQFVATMEAIKQSGLIREDGDIVRIIHPLMQQALLDELSAAMRRALHLELSEVIADSTQDDIIRSRAQGNHLQAAGRTTEAVSLYLAAADACEAHGLLHEQYADLVRALEIEQRIDHRIPLLKKCAFSATQLGSHTATEHWGELARIAAARSDNEMYAYALFQQYWTSYDGTQLDRLERAATLGPSSYGWSARAAANLCTLATDYEGAIMHDETALALAREAGDRLLEALTLEKLGLAYSYCGRIDEAIEALHGAVTIASAERLHSWAIIARTTLAETYAERLDTAKSLAECQAAAKYVEDLSLERFRSFVEGYLARAALRSGSLDTAAQYAAAAHDSEARFPTDRHTALIALAGAEIAAELGDPVAGAVATDRAIEAASAHGYTSWIFEARYEQMRLLARTGELDAALAIARELTVDEPISQANLALWCARIGWMHERADFTDRAREVRSDVEADTPLCELTLAEADATLTLIESGDATQLAAVANRWTDADRPLDALRAQMSVALKLVRAKDKTAVDVMRSIQQGFIKCGATYDADFASGLLRQLGTRSRAKSRTTSVGPLTRRELEIARLVASGLKNGEVASQLFLSEKTVAAHLSNIYGKVDVRSRVQLAAWLAEHDTEAAAATA